MSDNNIDDILATGTEAEIEAALADMDTTGDILFDEETPKEPATSEKEVVTPEVEEKDVVEANAETLVSSTTETEDKQPGVIEKDGKLYAEISADNAVIESKNGKHHVPYDVLANARHEAAQTKIELEAQRQANEKLQADFAETKRVTELYSKQLDEAGLDPQLLPEQMLKDPDLMAKIKEDYPQIGELVEALASQVTQNQPEVAQQQSDDPLQEAFSQTEHLKTWQNEDADRWEMAKIIDNKLADDPSFKDKPLSERLTEVEKRVMSAFGDEVAQQPVAIDKPIQIDVKAPIPNSPTEIGTQGNSEQPFSHVLEQDAGAMTAQMESMTNAQIEALLEDASNFL